MPASRTLLAAFAVASFAFVPAAAQAQQDKATAKADIVTWSQAVSQAFGPGYWEGEMKELDAAGNVVNSENKPDCIKAGESSKMASSLGDMFTMIVDMADCTTVSGGPGSLNLRLDCQAPGNKRMSITSSGTFSDGVVSWGVDFKADGDAAPESRSMRMTARRTKTTCS